MWDWTWSWGHALAAMLGNLAVILCFHIKERWVYRYGWRCPEKRCGFRMRTDNKEALEVVKRDHFETFHAPRFRRNA